MGCGKVEVGVFYNCMHLTSLKYFFTRTSFIEIFYSEGRYTQEYHQQEIKSLIEDTQWTWESLNAVQMTISTCKTTCTDSSRFCLKVFPFSDMFT